MQILLQNPFIKKCIKYKWITIMAVSAILFMLYRHNTVFATISYETMRAEVNNFMNGFNTTNFTHMKNAYSSMKEFAMQAQGTPSGLRKFIIAFANILVVIFAAMGVIKESQKGEISMDYWYRIFVVTIGAVIVVSSVNLIMDYLYGIGDYVVTTISYYMENSPGSNQALNLGEGQEEARANFIDALSTLPGLNGDENGNNTLRDLMDAGEGDVNFWAMQEAHSMLTPLMLFSYAPLVICIFLVYSATFEIRIRQLFAPVAVASIAYEGGRSAGVRFLKKYLSCFIKIGIYFFIAAIGSQMTRYFYQKLTSTGSSGDVTTMVNLVMMLMSNVIAAMSMMQTGGLGDEIVGV